MHVSLCCSILGMNLFGCKFCETMKGSSDVECDRKNFDSLLWAIVTVFQVQKLKTKKEKDTFPRIFSRAFLTFLYSVYYLYIYILVHIYINVIPPHLYIFICVKYLFILHIRTVTFGFTVKAKLVRSHKRPPTLYDFMRPYAGNVYTGR